jgi:AcrR family transcriptional regulator
VAEDSQGTPEGGKAARTRELVRDTALRLFRELGYDGTTMRGIAAEAGLSPGLAYYYFPTKEALVQEFYDEIQREHRATARVLLDSSRDFEARLRGALHAGFDVLGPYHGFAGTFIKVALEPRSPSSPFSDASAGAREAGIAFFGEVLDGSSLRLDPALRAALPELLWMAELGVTLFWVHDASPDQAKTRALIEGLVPVLVRLLKASRLPVLRSLTSDVLALVERVRP